MLQFYQEEDYENTVHTSPFNSEPTIRHIAHNKVCIIYDLKNKFSCCFFLLARINSKNSSFRKSS
jgi:hypothetical protein